VRAFARVHNIRYLGFADVSNSELSRGGNQSTPCYCMTFVFFSPNELVFRQSISCQNAILVVVFMSTDDTVDVAKKPSGSIDFLIDSMFDFLCGFL
jgi:hypothetical protein